MAKRPLPPTLTSVRVFCNHSKQEYELLPGQLWFKADCDPCGRYDAEISLEYQCVCGRKHVVNLDNI